MADIARSVTWEAPEHHHIEKNGDWFWILGIMTIVGSIAAFFFGNFLFAILILIAGGTTALIGNQEPKVITFAISTRGLRVGSVLYPYSSLECFYLDEDAPHGPEVLARSNHLFMPLIIMPIPEEFIEEIESILESRLPEEHLEEPVGHKILELFGF